MEIYSIDCEKSLTWNVGDTLLHTHPINGIQTIKKIESESELFNIKVFGTSAKKVESVN